jgi:hypothetical protein
MIKRDRVELQEKKENTMLKHTANSSTQKEENSKHLNQVSRKITQEIVRIKEEIEKTVEVEAAS